MEPKKIAVLFGGCSSEHEISLPIRRRRGRGAGPRPLRTGVDRHHPRAAAGCGYRGPPPPSPTAAGRRGDCTPALISPDRELHGLLEFAGGRALPERLDAAFPVLHGKNGEDGTVQGLAGAGRASPAWAAACWPRRWAWTRTPLTGWRRWPGCGCPPARLWMPIHRRHRWRRPGRGWVGPSLSSRCGPGPLSGITRVAAPEGAGRCRGAGAAARRAGPAGGCGARL